jgi:hypothetical protein
LYIQACEKKVGAGQNVGPPLRSQTGF